MTSTSASSSNATGTATAPSRVAANDAAMSRAIAANDAATRTPVREPLSAAVSVPAAVAAASAGPASAAASAAAAVPVSVAVPVPAAEVPGSGSAEAVAPLGVRGGREQIDAIDAELIALVQRRMAVSAEIQTSRIAEGGRRLDLRRETEVIGHYTRALGRPGTSVAMALLELGRGRV